MPLKQQLFLFEPPYWVHVARTRGRTSPPADLPPAATGPWLCLGRGRWSVRGRRRRGGRPPGCARPAGRAAPAAGTRSRWRWRRGGRALLTGDRPGRPLSGWLEISFTALFHKRQPRYQFQWVAETLWSLLKSHLLSLL